MEKPLSRLKLSSREIFFIKHKMFFIEWAPLKIQISSQHFIAHKKCFLTYQLYAALPFFARASFCLEL